VPIPTDPDLRYLAINKPTGITTTLRDRHATRTIAELLPPDSPRLVPVGRLDRESEGLVLMTNDGDLAHRLQHPKFGVHKEYLVEVLGEVPANVTRRLMQGLELDDGPARAIRARVSARSKRRSAITVVMGEGRKRELRRMFSVLGLRVERLVRVRFGPIRLGRLGPGEARPLDTEEVMELYRVTGLVRARRG
jgi:pseudouridine synthase